jgi:hypothetical protein
MSGKRLRIESAVIGSAVVVVVVVDMVLGCCGRPEVEWKLAVRCSLSLGNRVWGLVDIAWNDPDFNTDGNIPLAGAYCCPTKRRPAEDGTPLSCVTLSDGNPTWLPNWRTGPGLFAPRGVLNKPLTKRLLSIVYCVRG